MQHTKGWYHYTIPSGEYYAAVSSPKKTYIFHGDGSRRPTPKEYFDLLTEGSYRWVDEASGLVCEDSESDTEMGPVALPSGVYAHQSYSPSEDLPERLIPIELRTDKSVRLEKMYDKVSEDIEAFLRSEEIYRKIGTQYRRGILLYGPPGNGKTSFIRGLVRDALPDDSITVFFEGMPTATMIQRLADAIGDRLKVFVFEELANVAENSKLERLLDFLDGEKSVDKSVIIATTNYPERLPGNLVDRPSRFDKLYKMGNPSSKEREALLAHYLMRTPSEDEIRVTGGLSTAAIKECCVLHHIKGLTVDQATKALKEHSELVKKEFAETRTVGIGLVSFSHDD